MLSFPHDLNGSGINAKQQNTIINSVHSQTLAQNFCYLMMQPAFNQMLCGRLNPTK